MGQTTAVRPFRTCSCATAGEAVATTSESITMAAIGFVVAVAALGALVT